MFNKGAFVHWWTAGNLAGLGLNSLSIHAASVQVVAHKKSVHWVFCEGLMLGDKTAHLTITPDKGNDTFEYFHLTLDQPDVMFDKDGGKKGKGELIRCDHVFFEADEVGDVIVTSNLYDIDGKNTTASSKEGLTHNQGFLKAKVLGDINKIMMKASSVLMPQHWH